jgi:hypothetical protein
VHNKAATVFNRLHVYSRVHTALFTTNRLIMITASSAFVWPDSKHARSAQMQCCKTAQRQDSVIITQHRPNRFCTHHAARTAGQNVTSRQILGIFDQTLHNAPSGHGAARF